MKIKVEEFVAAAGNVPVLDVRSPGEFNKGHFPGAVSFPLFSDTERAEVGTLYKQVGQQQAMERGLELVSPKIREMVVEAQEIATDKKLLIHCWRGGLRSQSVAGLLKVAGIEVKVLEGGYKAYRRWVLNSFEKEYRFQVLGGMTGSGKTEVLQLLKEAGEEVIDLEKIADHRGSSFGRLGAYGRITQAQFENDLANQLFQKEKHRIWLEDESRQIGSLIIPNSIWEQMMEAPFVFLDPQLPYRVAKLIEDYGSFEVSEIQEAIDRIKRRLGRLRHRQAMAYLHDGNKEDLVTMLLEYYDKSYLHAMKDRRSQIQSKVDPSALSRGQLIDFLLKRGS